MDDQGAAFHCFMFLNTNSRTALRGAVFCSFAIDRANIQWSFRTLL